MKITLLTALFAVLLASLHAQTPTSCFEIESILVDACGNPEGENEMVRFHVGPTALNVNNLTVSFPNNPWLGICQNATTASKVAQLNATIVNCGLLREPVGGILPAGSKVILVTSTNFDVASNSFAGLSDTLYIIFQCQGNTSGHFANATGNGNRTLSMTFSSPAGCTDVVTYNCQSLVDINGNTGTSGPSSDRDGSTAEFSWNGTPSYVNYGCSAPFQPQTVDAGQGGSVCQGDTVQLQGMVTGAFSSYSWSGGTGTFINPSSLNAQYIVGAGDSGPLNLTLTAFDCNGSVSDVIVLNVNNGGVPVNITPPGPVSLCGVGSVQFTASGSGPFLWNTGATTASITVTTPGTYYVTVAGSCGSSSDTAIVSSSGVPPTASISSSAGNSLCPGNSLVLTASGGGSYLWSTGATTSQITVTTPGNFSVIVSDSCGSDTTAIVISPSNLPSVSIVQGTDSTICQGQLITLTATGADSYVWSSGQTTATVQVGTAGIISVVGTNSCGTDTAFFNIMYATVTADFTTNTISGQVPLSVQFTNGSSPDATHFSWNFGDGGNSTLVDPVHQFESPGTFFVILTASTPAGCSDTAMVTITVDSCNYELFIPNTFTPNGDGINDEYFLKGECLRFINVYIFNRWGAEIFSWDTLDGKWQGQTNTGAIAQEGTYVYVIDTEDYNGNRYHYSAMIMLLR